MNGLEAIDVFLDTSVFVALNYSYGNPLFEALRERVNQGKARLVIPSTTIEEVKAHIRKDITSAAQALKKARNDARILRNSQSIDVSLLFEKFDSATVEKELIDQFEVFLHDLKAEVVQIEQADIKHIFNLYFNSESPFRPGKKKFEFPDAFALSALNEWATDCKVKLHVASGDKDMQGIEESFPNLVAVKSLEEFLNSVSLYFDELAPLAQELLQKNMPGIRESIGEEFGRLGFSLEEQYGDAYDVQVLEVMGPEKYLISLHAGDDDVPGEAQFELTTLVRYSAEVSYDNLETAAYDSEDKILIPWEKVEKTVEATEIVRIHLSFSFFKKQPNEFEVQELRIQDPKDVEVPTSEPDGWPYK
jgi:hypothetical protein